MNEEDIKSKTFKISIYDEFDYQELKKVIEVIENLNYKCKIVDNGNIVFVKKSAGVKNESETKSNSFLK